MKKKLFQTEELKPFPPVPYTLEDEDGEDIQDKYHEQELARGLFDFASNKKVEYKNIIFYRLNEVFIVHTFLLTPFYPNFICFFYLWRTAQC